MTLNTITKLAGFSLFLGAVACGGSDPDIAQIRADFDSPSGSVQDQNGILAANGKREASGGVLGLNGASGQALTATGKVEGLARLNPQALLDKRFRRIYYLTHGRTLSPLVGNGDDFGCDNTEAARRAQEDLEGDLAKSLIFSGGRRISAKASYSIDLAECSTNLSGNVSFTFKVEITENKVEMSVKETLTDVCESTGNKACANGVVLAEASAMNNDLNLGSLQFITGWDLNATWEENGAKKSAKTEGGIRIAANNERFSLEYLVYCADSAGNRVSYVLRIEGDQMGGLTLEIEGQDGKLTCNVQADGSGACTGTGPNGGTLDVTWTPEQLDKIVDAPEFRDI